MEDPKNFPGAMVLSRVRGNHEYDWRSHPGLLSPLVMKGKIMKFVSGRVTLPETNFIISIYAPFPVQNIETNFQKLFTRELRLSFTLFDVDLADFPQLEAIEVIGFEERITKDEVRQTLKTIKTNKTPGIRTKCT